MSFQQKIKFQSFVLENVITHTGTKTNHYIIQSQEKRNHYQKKNIPKLFVSIVENRL